MGEPATTIHLSASDLALRWRVSVGHLANMRSAATGPAYLKLGGRVLYRLADIEDYEERSRVSGSAA
ncbi:helix-turn-helix domain-containing protein [Staphylococcus capitis]|uniref:helix-turn-helix domain-containing protein n=1 Tax=Staphylococcus capitis TaxID=29388 RepID=UPI003D05A1C5